MRYAVDAVWSTSSLRVPPLQGVSARRPGGAGALVASMDDELLAIHLRNTSAVPAERSRLLLFVSTALSAARGGAPVRQLSIQMRADVKTTKPIEPDYFQGWGDLPGRDAPPGIAPSFHGGRECFLSWWGNEMPLQLAGGSAQLVRYTLLEPGTPHVARDRGPGTSHQQQVARAPPRRASPVRK